VATSHRRPLLTVWLGWLLLMADANIPAPLYAVYADRYGFTSLVLTLIFATYAITLVLALLVFGRLSDRFGRRPVILLGIAVGCLALMVFAAASSTTWLFVARALQGLAVGVLGGPATAALVEIDPLRDERRPALLAGLAQVVGSGLGPLISGPLAQWAPAPERLAYLVMLAVTLVAAAFTAALPEPRPEGRERWRMQWPRVPTEIRVAFARVSLTAALVWAAVALYLSIVPSYAGDLLGTDNLALLGAVSAVALAASAAAQVLSRRTAMGPRRAQALGLALLAVGLGLLVAAAPAHSLAELLLGALVTGGGHGLAILPAQDEVNRMVPGHRRAEVTAAFICCIYLLVGGGVVAAGLLDLWLSLAASVAAVAVVLGTGALATAVWQAGIVSRPGAIRRS
jgi:MFS family permease